MIKSANRKGVPYNDDRPSPPSEPFQGLDILLQHLFGISVTRDSPSGQFRFKAGLRHACQTRSVSYGQLTLIEPVTCNLKSRFRLTQTRGSQHFVRNYQGHGLTSIVYKKLRS